MALRRITDATTEPLTTAEVKTHLRITSSSEDSLLDTYVKAARQMAENELQRSLLTQTWEKTLDEFPDAIELPYPPVLAVSAVTYYDSNGALQTLSPAEWTSDIASEPGWVVPAYGYDWPQTRAMLNAVKVTYTAGYGAAAASVPQAIRQWILLMVGHLYENREASVQNNMPGLSATKLPFVDGLLDGYRVALL